MGCQQRYSQQLQDREVACIYGLPAVLRGWAALRAETPRALLAGLALLAGAVPLGAGLVAEFRDCVIGSP
jgi:hypothetical protein